MTFDFKDDPKKNGEEAVKAPGLKQLDDGSYAQKVFIEGEGYDVKGIYNLCDGADDRVKIMTWLDYGTENERVDSIELRSASLGKWVKDNFQYNPDYSFAGTVRTIGNI